VNAFPDVIKSLKVRVKIKLSSIFHLEKENGAPQTLDRLNIFKANFLNFFFVVDEKMSVEDLDLFIHVGLHPEKERGYFKEKEKHRETEFILMKLPDL
jgi:hypothetical protein